MSKTRGDSSRHDIRPGKIALPTATRARARFRDAWEMLNEYEQRREARIARNREILMRLVGDLPAHKALMEADQPASPKPKSAKRKAASIPEAEQRRSGRIRNMPAPIYTSFEVDEDLGDAGARAARREARRKASASSRAGGAAVARDKVASRGSPRPPGPPAKGSIKTCLLYTSPSPRDKRQSRMPSSA